MSTGFWSLNYTRPTVKPTSNQGPRGTLCSGKLCFNNCYTMIMARAYGRPGWILASSLLLLAAPWAEAGQQAVIMGSSSERGNSLKEIQTFAALEHDPLALLGQNFTICTQVSKDTLESQVHFTLLGENEQRFLGLFAGKTGKFLIYTSSGFFIPTCLSVPAPPAHQWTRACLAVRASTGGITFVVNGMVIEDTEVEEVRLSSDNSPTNLTGRLVLGTFQARSGEWRTGANTAMVTGVHVFSTALTKDRMVGLTRGGGEECGGEGDYLAWRRMEWQLKGEAEVAAIGEPLPCGGEDPDIRVECPAGCLRNYQGLSCSLPALCSEV